MLSRVFACICLVSLGIVVVGCSPDIDSRGDKIVVTILPLKYLTQKIVGDDFDIITLVPPGSSPETYEPTPQQMVDVSSSMFLFSTGLIDFERELAGKFETFDVEVVSLGDDLELIHGICSHGHSHGADPHIWSSPEMLKRMAARIYAVISDRHPDSLRYGVNFQQLIDSITVVDSNIRGMVDSSSVESFVVFHPALTYYARDYGLEQISIERDGKEPTALEQKKLIKSVEEKKIDKVLYQRQFSRSVVMAFVKETGLEPVEFDPLDENVLGNLESLTRIITSRK